MSRHGRRVDETLEGAFAAVLASARPDPLFRRRLRGHVLNQFVASREGLGSRRDPGEMGRLGRAVLYASFALALSVTGAMAASQSAVPGEPFYPLKRQLEALRIELLPAHVHDELAAQQLAERIAELDRLAEAGDWAAVARHARAVQAAYAAAIALGGHRAEVAHLLEVAAGLLDRLPESARAVVGDALTDLRRVGPPQDDVPPARRADDGDRPSGGGAPPDRPRPTDHHGPRETPATHDGGGEPAHTPAATPRPMLQPQPTAHERSGGHAVRTPAPSYP